MSATPSPFALARARAGLAQTEVAARTGVSQRLVSDYDQGHYPRSVVLAAKAARAVGLTLDEMFPGAADEDPDAPAELARTRRGQDPNAIADDAAPLAAVG